VKNVSFFHFSCPKMLQIIVLPFMSSGIGIPVAAMGLIYPVWVIAVMAVRVTAIFFNSLWGRPSLFFDALSAWVNPFERNHLQVPNPG